MYKSPTVLVFSEPSAELMYREVMTNISDPRFQAQDMERVVSRNGYALRMNSVTVMEFTRPDRCVILDPIRNCNPFLHLAESMWMLAGRNDLEFITKFTPSMNLYSDDGETLHSAYGHRWRNHFGFDQIRDVIKNLKEDSMSRRELVVMWDPSTDHKYRSNGGKDLSCNFAVKFALRQNRLNMTVFNRSNDSVFGCPGGANSVHFAFLHQFVSAATGLPMGTYTQISDDLHLYCGGVYRELESTLLTFKDDQDKTVEVNLHLNGLDSYESPDATSMVKSYGGIKSTGDASRNVFGESLDAETVLREIEDLVERPHQAVTETPFLRDVAQPIIVAYLTYFKENNDPAYAQKFLQHAAAESELKSLDWFVSCDQWLERVIQKRNKKKEIA